ncbi:MAG: fasciclin domain-containing protein [Shimia sp.]|uniref:fasciclin domain-containing protein n=1 Tax=Shimia sp. TaxID=1954381 RepID=UPI0040591618
MSLVEITASGETPGPAPTPAATASIATIAATNGNFDILVAALDAAGLVETFANPGDFTVFAPTDEAFTILAQDTFGIDTAGMSETDIAVALVDLLGVETLTNVLFYHVQAGSSSLEDVQDSGSVDTLLEGASFGVDGDTLNDADPDVEDPEFVDGLTDIAATNGVIHVIDRVLLPIDVAEVTSQPTIADIASTNPAFEALTGALVATGLVGLFTDPANDFTVFAPTDDAFRALAEELGINTHGVADADLPAALVGALGIDLVREVLLYHVRPGGLSLEELQESGLVETALPGGNLVIDGNTLVDLDPDRPNPNFVDGLTDIEAVNGDIQVIDSVLLPIDVGSITPQFLFGGFGQDIQVGSGARDVLFGFFGDDIQLGGGGGDRIFGSLGDDTMFGGDGNDVMRGGVGDDHMSGDAGNDRMFGSWGNDWMSGGNGADRMRGGSDRDTIDGGNGHDVILGNRGADMLSGGNGDDHIRGGSGQDTIDGGAGDDELVGGGGADHFVFTSLSGDDTILDFRWNDTIVLDSSEFSDFAAVMDATTISGGEITITGENGTITFHGTGLTEGDFLFM